MSETKKTSKKQSSVKKTTKPSLKKQEVNKKDILFASTQTASEMLIEQGYEPLDKTEENLSFIAKKLEGSAKRGGVVVPRMAFTEKPNNRDSYAGVYKTKTRLLPDTAIKDIRVKDHLVAAILNARGNTMSMFSHFKIDRFDIGLEIDLKPEYQDAFSEREEAKINARIDRFKKLLVTCGHETGLQEEEKMSLSDYMYLQTKNGLAFGRNTTDITYDDDGNFSYFRPNDAGTIYRAVRRGEYAKGIRESSIAMLEQITGDKIDIDFNALRRDEYEWIQVVDQIPRQAFSSREMLVHNFYPSTDVEHNGYPVTPLDNVISSVTTHLSIESYQKLYFMNGRATKGFLVLKSDEADQAVIDSIKQEYVASINNVENSFRTPIFGVGTDDDVQWVATTPQKKDGEFEFLYEQVSRNILSAFNMSPDELPGYTHLSRGTNQKTLTESNNEFKLTASRDTGLRPLIIKWQEFFNRKLLPIMDPELAQIIHIKVSGLDAQSKQEESLRFQQDQAIHMTMDEIMEAAEKDKVGQHLAGEVVFNEYYTQAVDKYIDVNHFMAEKLGDPAHRFNTLLKFKRDAFWQQNMQMLTEMKPEAVQAYFAEDPEFSFEMYKEFMNDILEDEKALLGEDDDE